MMSRREDAIFRVAAYVLLVAAGLVGNILAPTPAIRLPMIILLLAIAVIQTLTPKADSPRWLIHLYLGSAVLKRFEDDGRPEEDLPLLTWAMDDSLHTIQESLKGVLQNFPVPGLGRLIKWIIFPFGSSYPPPADETTREVAEILLTENDARDRLVEGVYLSDQEDAPGHVQTAFHLVLTATQAENAIRNALKTPVTWENHEELVRKAVESGVITEEQATTVRLAQEAVRRVIEVDSFSREEIEGSGPATASAANEAA